MLGAFMSGLTSGMESMLNLRQKADELRMQLDSNEQLRAAAKDTSALKTGPDYGGGGDLPTSTPDFPIPTDATPTTGSGGGDGGAGGAARSSSGGGGAGGWGEHAKTVIDTLKGMGWKDGAIQGVLANGLAEGGFKNNWVPGDDGNSRGHFQFYSGGEMPGYLKWAGANNVTDPHDTAAQTQYLAKRMEEIHPGFGQIDNPYDATDIVGTRFERYKGAAPGQRYGQLATAQKYYGMPNYGVGTTAQPSTIAGPQLAVGGGIAGGTGQPAPGYSPPAPTGPALAVGGAMAGGQGQLAPGFARGPTGQLTRNGQPPDTYIHDPAVGGAVPAWTDGSGTSGAPAAPTQALSPPTTYTTDTTGAKVAVPLTQKQQYDADNAAGRRPIFPPGQKFNSRGEAIARDLKAPVPGAYIPAGAPAPGYAPRRTAALDDLSGGALA